jgi:hypothetical protein
MTHVVLVTAGVICALVFLLFFSIVLDHYRNMVGWSLILPIARARGKIRQLVRAKYPDARISSFGASAISPIYLCMCIDMQRDSEKEDLLADAELMNRMREALRDSRYPANAISAVTFSIESQQTVDRDFGGNWFYARK